MTIGIIGVGIEGMAVATGLLEIRDTELQLLLSERTKAKSAALKEKYPDRVKVFEDNQDVVDGSDWVMLAVMPKQAENVLSALKFHAGQKFISLVPTLSLKRAAELTGLPDVFDVLPMPFCAKHIGPVAMYPGDEEVGAVLRKLGTLVVAQNGTEMACFRTVTCLMSAYYQLLAKSKELFTDAGASAENAEAYISTFFEALAKQAQLRPENLQELAEEMTPGGLNYFIWNDLGEAGLYDRWKQLMEDVLARVKKD